MESTASQEVVSVRFERITVDPHKMGGVPCIRGLRMPVATVIAMVADRMSVEEILRERKRSKRRLVRRQFREDIDA